MSSVHSANAPRLVFATGNAHKVAELEAIIAPLLPEGAGRIARMSDFDVTEPVEDGATFAENSFMIAGKERRIQYSSNRLVLYSHDDHATNFARLSFSPLIRSFMAW